MNDSPIRYQVNEQGMIVEEIYESDENELRREEKYKLPEDEFDSILKPISQSFKQK